MSAPRDQPPRYLPGYALPARAYVPGSASPVPDEAALAAPPGLSPSPPLPASGDDASGDWQRHPAFLWGLDLYNHGYPWEAHVAWESLWLHAPRGSVVRDMLQALIQCAAAVVHARDGRPTGHARLTERALERLAGVRARAGSRCLGIDIDALVRALGAYRHADRAGDWPRIALAPGA